ncbi:MAG: hypothetical protein J0L72_04220 [Armatimonadetes bacterium]|nr:hypothetical protein [Armatimonadota bacterium]
MNFERVQQLKSDRSPEGTEKLFAFTIDSKIDVRERIFAMIDLVRYRHAQLDYMTSLMSWPFNFSETLYILYISRGNTWISFEQELGNFELFSGDEMAVLNGTYVALHHGGRIPTKQQFIAACNSALSAHVDELKLYFSEAQLDKLVSEVERFLKS